MKIKNYNKKKLISLKFKKILYFKKYNCMSKIFLKWILSFILMLQFTNKLMNKFNYFITTYFILC